MAGWMTLAEAVAAHVHDGEILAMEGFTHLIPFAAGHEIIRQRRRNLSLIRTTPDLNLRPIDRRGLRFQTHFLLGRKSRSGVATQVPRRGRE
jgi:acyl CoA:acetate/3-ketoacid CoA transferase alpha subunit